MWPFTRSKPSKVVLAPVTVHTQPIVTNPSDAEGLKFAAYRADAILRDMEQRKSEHRAPNRDHVKLISEAQMYAHMLVGAKKWSEIDFAKFEARLEAVTG